MISERNFLVAILMFVIMLNVSVFGFDDEVNDKHSGHHHHHLHSHDDFDDDANDLDHDHYSEDGEHNDEFDHEAVIGSKREAELFHSYTIEEAKQRLAEIVKKIDVNNDGVVSEIELQAWLKQNLRNLDVEAAEEEYAKHNSNAQTPLSWATYVQSLYGYTVDEVEKFAAEPTDETKHFLATLNDDRARWMAADLNKDGELELKEFVAFVSPYNYEHMQSYEVDRVLGQFDDSADGIIDLKEFTAHESDGELDEEARLSIADQFRELDKDGDGKLVRDEVRDWVAPGLDDSAELEARHLFELTNTDSNSHELTLDEILEHHSLWVGSQEDGNEISGFDESIHTEL